MKDIIRDYFKRIFSNCTKVELIFWWILRAAMIYGIIDTTVNGSDYGASNPVIQMYANLVGMFAYEICQMLPKKCRMRFLSPRFQNITALGFFLGSFGGAYLNLYYALPGYDKVLHALGTAEAVYIGYEYVSATQLKFKKTCPHQIATLCALGLGFVFSSAWEVFEFTYDQIAGGDAQHWSYENALQAANNVAEDIFFLFDIPTGVEVTARFALMDTMGDIVLNFVGAFIMYIILCIVPYRHRGKNNINVMIEKMNANKNEIQYSNK